MSNAQGTSHPEPATPDKIYFWLGGRLPNTFNAWVEEEIRSKWFPLRRMTPAALTVVTWIAVVLASERSLTYLLLVAAVPILLGVVASFLFRDRLRRRALRRYQIPE